MADLQMVQVGRVDGFFAHPSVAMVELSGTLKVGDAICVKGHTTDFQQTVESMQIDRQPVQEAAQGASVGLQVKDRCRKNDVVYKLS